MEMLKISKTHFYEKWFKIDLIVWKCGYTENIQPIDDSLKQT